MPFVERDAEKENAELEELLKTEEGRKAHELFQAEYEFRKSLLQARRKANLSQEQVAMISGLSKQSVSRIEKTSNVSISSLMKYLNAVGATLTII